MTNLLNKTLHFKKLLAEKFLGIWVAWFSVFMALGKYQVAYSDH